MSIKIIPKSRCNREKLKEHILDYLSLGEARTWRVTSSGKIVHTPAQWRGKAFFYIDEKGEHSIDLYLGWPKYLGITQETYVYYHGHFVSFILIHFGEYISRVEVSNGF